MRTPRYLTAPWLFLMLLGLFYLFAPLSDLVADARTRLPTDHAGTFREIAGVGWEEAQISTAGQAHYITLLEIAYAVHELVFGILFLVILAIPFRSRMRWAWWSAWAVMLANITYSLTFGSHDATVLYRTLVADLLLPVLLLVHIPAFFPRHRRP